MTELRKARLTGIRVAVPVEALEGRLSDLPAGVVVERDRIEGALRRRDGSRGEADGAGAGADARLRAL